MSNFRIQADRALDLVITSYLARRPVMLKGPPGCGKTAMVHLAADELSKRFNGPVLVRELHLASMSEVDVRGYLIPDGDRARFTKPEFWEAIEQSERGILFLDEFPQASHEVQKAVAPLLLEGRIGEHRLPPGWAVILAGNDIDHGAGANTLLSHVINRIAIVEVAPPSPQSWAVWAMGKGLPPELIAFAQVRPNVVFSGELPAAADTPYCTPRSMEIAGDLANSYPGGLREMVKHELGMALLAGAIGEGPAAELATVVRTAINLPSYDDVVRAPDKAPVPEEPDMAYAMVMLVAMNAKVEDAAQVVEYIQRFQDNYAILGIVSLVRRNRLFAATKAFHAWCSSRREMLGKFQRYVTDFLK